MQAKIFLALFQCLGDRPAPSSLVSFFIPPPLPDIPRLPKKKKSSLVRFQVQFSRSTTRQHTNTTKTPLSVANCHSGTLHLLHILAAAAILPVVHCHVKPSSPPPTQHACPTAASLCGGFCPQSLISQRRAGFQGRAVVDSDSEAPQQD